MTVLRHVTSTKFCFMGEGKTNAKDKGLDNFNVFFFLDAPLSRKFIASSSQEADGKVNSSKNKEAIFKFSGIVTISRLRR